MEHKYVQFFEMETKNKTKVFELQNIAGDILGEIKWFSHWRQYCFYPNNETIWARGCLAEIQEFIYKLMSEKQNKKGL